MNPTRVKAYRFSVTNVLSKLYHVLPIALLIIPAAGCVEAYAQSVEPFEKMYSKALADLREAQAFQKDEKFADAEKKYTSTISHILLSINMARSKNVPIDEKSANIVKVMAYSGRGNSRFAEEKYSEAIKDYDWLVSEFQKKRCSSSTDQPACERMVDLALCGKGASYYELKNYDDAISSFTAFLENNKEGANASYVEKAHYYRGLARLSKSDNENALKDFIWVSDNGKENAWNGYSYYCITTLRLGNDQDALVCSDALIKNFPKSSLGHELKGRAHLHDYEENLTSMGYMHAENECQKALDLKPDNENAKQCVVKAKQYAEELKNMGEAVKDINEMLDLLE